MSLKEEERSTELPDEIDITFEQFSPTPSALEGGGSGSVPLDDPQDVRLNLFIASSR